MSLKALLRPAAVACLTLALAAAAPALAQQEGLKIAVIDVQRIITDSATGKSALATLEEFGKDQQERIRTKRTEIDDLRNRISEGQLSLSEDRLEELQKELETKTIELRRATDDAQREFNRRQEQALKEIERQVMPIIQQVGQEEGYTMIFRKFDSGLVFATDSIDITTSVIERLDAGQGGGGS